tara:strand:- start:137 stop:610 length:474 start_codon:yes stop_codon:yes gene_type:complete
MPTDKIIEVIRADPREAKIRKLIESLDVYMLALYPSESTHRVDTTFLASRNARFFSALCDGMLVGCGGILIEHDYAEVKRIFVSPKARGLGVGRKLMERLEVESRRLGFKLLRLETGIYQPEALALFKAMGFIPRLSFGDYPNNDPNSIFMEKQVTS